MTQLGYDAAISLIETKITDISKTPIDAVFVVEIDGGIVGCISCHITSLFHQEGSAGRITSLVIDQGHQGMGVGKLLVSEAEAFFHSSGWVKSEVTSGEQRPEAHAFYKSCGYKQDERRYTVNKGGQYAPYGRRTRLQRARYHKRVCRAWH